MAIIPELDSDYKAVRRGLLLAGVPSKIVDTIRTKALRTGRRTTGAHQTNRAFRWTTGASHPQYGTEEHSRVILLRLLGMLCEFTDAPDLDDATRTILAKYIDRKPEPGTYRDALTLERLSYPAFVAEAASSRAGHSDFHIGHDDPTAVPKHVPDNISWRTKRSNLIQGDMTLRESRTKLVELIGRYFQLGEVTIHPDP